MRRRAMAGRDPLLEDAERRGAALRRNHHAGFDARPPLLQRQSLGSMIFMACLSRPLRWANSKADACIRARDRSNANFQPWCRSCPLPSPQKVALVTGAARGIGLATAKRFLAEGWRVALLDIEGELLRGAVAGLANPDNTLALACDVSDAGRRGGGDGDGEPTLRPARCAGQQCRGRGVRAAARNLRRGLEPHPGGQPHRAVPLHQGGGAR